MRSLSAFAASVLLLSVSSTVACGGSDAGADVAPPASEDELNTSTQKLYDCHGGSSDGNLNHWELSIANKKATIVDLSKDAAEPDDGTIDPSYSPTSSTYQDSSRYVGFGKLPSGDMTGIDLMVSKDVQSGKSGKAWLRYSSGEGGNTVSFRCDKKTKAIAVDTSKRARLSCSLKKSMCWDGNPPGQTCLFDFFVNQKQDDSVELKLAWIDHFGVHVQDRPEQVGASSSFDRSKTQVKAKWDKSSLTLKYRAGITYTGEFKQDDKTEQVQCNDLAMLDD